MANMMALAICDSPFSSPEYRKEKRMKLRRTYLSETMDEVDANRARYDNNVKMLLADPQVLAMILKYTVEKFAENDIRTIMNCMEEAEVSVTIPEEERYLKKNRERGNGGFKSAGRLDYLRHTFCSLYAQRQCANNN